METDDYLRYLGVLGLLARCYRDTDEDTQNCIEQAFDDACQAHPTLMWRRTISGIIIEPKG